MGLKTHKENTEIIIFFKSLHFFSRKQQT